MNAPFRLEPQRIPTVDRPEFKVAMAAAKAMGANPDRAQVRDWAEKMKRAISG